MIQSANSAHFANAALRSSNCGLHFEITARFMHASFSSMKRQEEDQKKKKTKKKTKNQNKKIFQLQPEDVHVHVQLQRWFPTKGTGKVS